MYKPKTADNLKSWISRQLGLAYVHEMYDKANLNVSWPHHCCSTHHNAMWAVHTQSKPVLTFHQPQFKGVLPDSMTLAVLSKSGIHSVYVKLHLGYRLDKESQPQYHCLHTYLKRRLTCFHGYQWHAWPKWPNLLTACMTRKILLEIKELEYPENSWKSASFSDCPQLGQTDTQGTVMKWNGPGVCIL